MASPREIVVVGAGIVGCAIAYELARRGASVIVVDDRAPGMGATQAAAGMLAPFLEAREEGPLLELTARSLGLFDEFVARLKSETNSKLEYERTGTLDVALDADALAALQHAHARLASRGVPSDLLDAAAVRQCEPHLSSAAVGGLLISTHGFVAAADLARALAAAAERHGARFLNRGRVTRVSQNGGGLEFHCAGARTAPLRGDAAVIAAGSWAGAVELEDVADRVPVRPIRGQLLHLRWPGQQLARVLWSERCYVVPWRDGTVLVGATEEDAGFDERTTLAGLQDLIDAACELLPHAWTASLLAAKVGLRPGTPDHLPIIGWSGVIRNLMYATGHFRNGILLAPLTAELVAGAILDGQTDPMLDVTRPQRFGRL